MSGDQVKSALRTAHPFDLGIIAAGVLAFLFSLFPYYTASISGLGIGSLGNGSVNAWHGFFGWFGALLALVGAVLVVLPLLGIRLGIPVRLAALAAFAGATLCTLLALLIIPGKADCTGLSVCEGLSYGHGFGFWATLLAVVVGLVLCVMRKDATA